MYIKVIGYLMLRALLSILFISSIALGGFLFTPLGLNASIQWLNDHIEELSIIDGHGTLSSAIYIGQIEWFDGSKKTSLNAVSFDLNPTCFLTFSICINDLAIDDLIIDVLGSEELHVKLNQDDQPIETAIALPEVFTPIPISIQQLAIARIIQSRSTDHPPPTEQLLLVDSLFKGCVWKEDQITIDNATSSRENVKIAIQGSIRLVQRYPINATVQVTAPSVDLNNIGSFFTESEAQNTDVKDIWHLALSGDLSELNWILTSNQNNHEDIKVHGNGWIVPEHPDLPFVANLVFNNSVGIKHDSLNLELINVKTQFQGMLRAVTDVRYSMQADTIVFQLQQLDLHNRHLESQGLINQDKLVINRLLIAKNQPIDNTIDTLALQGSVFFKDPISWNMTGIASQFTPLKTQPKLSIDGSFISQGVFSHSNSLVNLSNVNLLLTHGSPLPHPIGTSSTKVALTGNMSWRNNAFTDSSNPSSTPANPAVTSTVESSSQWQFDQLKLRSEKSTIDINGNYPLTQLQDYQLPPHSPQKNGISLLLDLKDNALFALLPIIWPHLPPIRGQAKGELILGQTRALSPTISGKLNAKDITIHDTQIASLTLKGSTNADPNAPLSMALSIEGLKHLSKPMGDLRINLSGSMAQPKSDIKWKKPQLGELHLGCQSMQNLLRSDSHWKCHQLNINQAVTSIQWRLISTFGLTLDRRDQSVSVSPLCITPTSSLGKSKQEEKLCLSKPITISSSQGVKDITIVADHFSWEWFSEFMPVGLSADGSWSLTISDLDIDQNGSIRGNAKLLSTKTQWLWQIKNQQKVQFKTERILGDMVVTNSTLHGKWSVSTDLFGSIDITAAPTITGHLWQFSLSKADLKLLNTIFPVANRLEGTLNGKLSFIRDNIQHTSNQRNNSEKSTVFHDFDGTFTLEKGIIQDERFPLAIESITLNGRFNKQDLNLTGRYTIGGSDGSVDGKFKLLNADIEGLLSLKAKDFRYEPNPTSWVITNPDIVIAIHNRTINVSGTIHAHQGKLQLDKLPKHSTDISMDTLIVDGSDKEEKWPYDINISLVMLDDIQFKSSGLDTKLAGNLQIRQHHGGYVKGKGIINLTEGRYNAYGQDLRITNGRLIFSGQLDNPDVSITAIRNNTPAHITVGIKFFGELLNPNISLFSSPPMSEQYKIHYLLTGQPPGTQSLSQKTLSQQSSLALALSLSNRHAEKIASRVGIDDLRFGTGLGNDGQELQVSGKLSPKLHIRYGYELFDQASSLTARYQIKRNFFVELFRGTSSAFDLLWLITGHE